VTRNRTRTVVVNVRGDLGADLTNQRLTNVSLGSARLLLFDQSSHPQEIYYPDVASNPDGPVTDAELENLGRLAEAASSAPWVASVEGRDHTSGDDVILVGEPEKKTCTWRATRVQRQPLTWISSRPRVTSFRA
jgi:hypothetical protein